MIRNSSTITWDQSQVQPLSPVEVRWNLPADTECPRTKPTCRPPNRAFVFSAYPNGNSRWSYDCTRTWDIPPMTGCHGPCNSMVFVRRLYRPPWRSDALCAQPMRPQHARPAHLKPLMDFNHKMYLDGVTWTNRQGKSFHFYHLLDAGSNYHVAITAPSKTTTDLINIINQHWISWAGPPSEMTIDSGTEMNSDIVWRIYTAFWNQVSNNMSRSTLAEWQDRATWAVPPKQVVKNWFGVSHRWLSSPPNGTQSKYPCKELHEYQKGVCNRGNCFR